MNTFTFQRTLRLVVAALAVLSAHRYSAHAFTLTVVDGDGVPISGFRWLVEEDTTHAVVPGALASDSLAVDLHGSHAPVLAKGATGTGSVEVDVDPGGRYHVSVLPSSGEYTVGGAPVDVGQQSVVVAVIPQPLPTAQISVFIFNDDRPINNEPDLPGEEGLEGFSIVLHDEAGQVMLDAFGNMLGTTYQRDSSGNVVFDNEGNPLVEMFGDGILLTGPNGELTVRNIPPGKYGVIAIPPIGQGWIQTGTIEGTPTVDAWVKAAEPALFQEFGRSFYHVFIGFVQEKNLLDSLPAEAGVGSITGRIVGNHLSRPPVVQFEAGPPVPEAWIGLSAQSSLEGVYARSCNSDGTFLVEGVPVGSYQLGIWDESLDFIFGSRTVTVPSGGATVDLGDIQLFSWFGHLAGYVFNDVDADGFRDPGEAGMRNEDVLLRFRDATVYQATVSDPTGYYSFDEVFPFFHWIVAEVGFGRYRATGATVVVDEGGVIEPHQGWELPSYDVLTPQLQAENNPNTGNNLSRTETGMVLTQAMWLMAGMTNRIDWG
ncbi:pectin esterase, partial [bacterium]|nr:pectin esterase [candidate division CSSED10-310 bacterium]